MTIPDNRTLTVTGLRQVLDLPATRPDGVRDLLVVGRDRGTPVPGAAERPWRLALGSWPETWRQAPETGPRYLVMLRQLTTGYVIATVEDIEPAGWAADQDTDPQHRIVPVSRTAYGKAAMLAGCHLDTNLTFGWPLPEEQYAFL
jgi:hypothetical protein